jgi:hypothetical protein
MYINKFKDKNIKVIKKDNKYIGIHKYRDYIVVDIEKNFYSDALTVYTKERIIKEIKMLNEFSKGL